MATGIPKGNRASGASVQYSIEYAGKRPESEILAGPIATLDDVFAVPGSDDNRLIYGENSRVLRNLLHDSSVAGKVRLVYIDPPYSTGARFESRGQDHAYEDTLTGAGFLEFLRERFILLRELLASDGSIYVHLDENMAFEAKLLLDEIFGPSNFRNWITRKKCNPKNYTRKTFGKVADYLLLYSKSRSYVFNQPFDAWTPETAKEYSYIEEATGRRYMKVPVHAPGVRNGATGGTWKGRLPPAGKHWQYTPAELDLMDARGEIYWSPTGNPRRKIYLDESPGVPIQDIWMGFRDAHNQNIKITGYPTEKNPDLIKRIVEASSNVGDIVLDAFSGSGTTAAVAEQTARHWIAVDNSPLAIDVAMRRLARGSDKMGDFVTRAPTVVNEPALSHAGRVLRTGVRVQEESGHAAGPIPKGLISEWRELLSGRSQGS